jgi:hypothetical protein
MKVKLIDGDSGMLLINWRHLDATMAGSFRFLTIELSYSVHVGRPVAIRMDTLSVAHGFRP